MHLRLGALAAIVCIAGCRPDLEGELKADGSFTGLQVFEADGSPWAGALSGSELVLLSLADGQQCRVSEVSSFLPASNAVLTWSSGALGFVDTSCRELIEPIATEAPEELASRMLGGRWSEHVFVTTADGVLRLINPWANEVIALGSEVRAWRWAEAATLWMFEGGALVLRDLEGTPDRQLGIEVNDVSFLSPGEAVYADRDGVWWVRSPLDEPELLAAGGCEPQALRDGMGVAYLAPCAERRLVTHDLVIGTTEVIASGVDEYRADTSPIYFRQGDMLFASTGGAVTEVAAQGVLSSVRRVSYQGQTAHLLLTTDMLLLRFDGSTTQTLFENVAAFQVRHEHIAVVDGAGTLLLQSEGGGGIEALSSAVPIDRFGFASQLEALGWIGGFDGVRGRLELDSLTTEDRGTLEDEASEFVEVRSDTLPGVAYLVPDGERAGIWFATP
ncbi:MAG TPA: hypothetical protein VFB62_21620 [Polyangiaceae bacterium]|nr:hypothetical protein [Polyangiaceae bacterium]